MTNTTWKPHTQHGELSSQERRELPDKVRETNWKQLGKRPHTPNPAQD